MPKLSDRALGAPFSFARHRLCSCGPPETTPPLAASDHCQSLRGFTDFVAVPAGVVGAFAVCGADAAGPSVGAFWRDVALAVGWLLELAGLSVVAAFGGTRTVGISGAAFAGGAPAGASEDALAGALAAATVGAPLVATAVATPRAAGDALDTGSCWLDESAGGGAAFDRRPSQSAPLATVKMTTAPPIIHDGPFVERPGGAALISTSEEPTESVVVPPLEA